MRNAVNNDMDPTDEEDSSRRYDASIYIQRFNCIIKNSRYGSVFFRTIPVQKSIQFTNEPKYISFQGLGPPTSLCASTSSTQPSGITPYTPGRSWLAKLNSSWLCQPIKTYRSSFTRLSMLRLLRLRKRYWKSMSRDHL